MIWLKLKPAAMSVPVTVALGPGSVVHRDQSDSNEIVVKALIVDRLVEHRQVCRSEQDANSALLNVQDRMAEGGGFVDITFYADDGGNS